MRALILFHLKSGIRIAVQSFAPLFCAIIAGIMLNMYPAAAVRMAAAALFRNSTGMVAAFAALAFLLPTWGAGRLSTGLNGWIRHLPLSAAENRRGLALGLVALQAPLAAALLVLAVVARSQNIPVAAGFARCALLLACGAAAALPVRRHPAVLLLAVMAAAAAVWGPTWLLTLSVATLVLADAAAGPVREKAHRTATQTAGTLFGVRTAWRAVRWRILVAYAAGLLTVGATALFVANNGVTGALLSATVRFGGAFAVVVFLSAVSEQLAVRRPVWPWARSLPWSSAQRTRSDAFMLGLAGLPLVVIAALIDVRGAVEALAACPFLAAREAGHLRGMPGRRAGVALVAAEGFAVASALAVVGWTAWIWLAALPLALASARHAETRQKVTRWVELHHTAAGDPLSWSG